jgi:hypothetical protein
VDGPDDQREEYVTVRTGRSGDSPMAFVFFTPGADRATLQFQPDFWPGTAVVNLLDGQRHPVEDGRLVIDKPTGEIAILLDADTAART